MIKQVTSLVLGLGILSFSGIALAGGETSPPDTELPAEVTQCLAACTDAAKCCAENKAEIEKLRAEIEKINNRLNPKRKPGYKPVDRLKELEARVNAAIAAGDAKTLKDANDALKAALKDYATLEQLTDVEARLSARIDGLETKVDVATTVNQSQSLQLTAIDKRVTNIENAKEGRGIDFLAKIGYLYLDSEMFTMGAFPVTVGLDFPVTDSIGIVVEGGALVSADSDEHGGIVMGYGRFNLPGLDGLALTAGADIFAAAPDSMVRWSLTGVAADGGLQYTNGIFTANLNGLAGGAAHHNGDQGFVYGFRAGAGLSL